MSNPSTPTSNPEESNFICLAYGTVGTYDAVDGEVDTGSELERMDSRASSAIESMRQHPEYQWEAYYCAVGDLIRAAETKNLEALCSKVPANIMKALRLQWLMAEGDDSNFSAKAIEHYEDFARNAHLITRDAAVELSRRRAEEAPEQERVTAEQMEAHRKVLKAAFRSILENPQVGDRWSTSWFTFTVVKIGEEDYYSGRRMSIEGRLEKVWRITVQPSDDSGILRQETSYSLAKFQETFDSSFQGHLLAVKRASA